MTATGTRPCTPGTDFLQLSLADAPSRGLTAWLADALRAAIMDGRLAGGSSLPATRVLAGDLGVSRGVIVEAYQRLHEEGLVRADRGAGTRVLPRPGPERPAAGLPAAGPRLPQPWRSGAGLDLSPGVPDLSGFPRAAWLRAERAVLDRVTAADLGYGDPRGSSWLRQELAGWLARTRGLRASPDDIIIVAGVAQALALLGQVLGRQGTGRVAVEDPGSRGARDQLAYWGLDPVPVPVDEHGLRAADLARSGATAVLLTPAHQFPTGVVLAPQRRRDLLAWAADGGLVIEDDYDAEFRYDRTPVPAVQASAPDRVAYLGSTSKTLVPGLRLGWLVPPARLRAAPDRREARERPGQPRAASAGARPPDRHRPAGPAHPGGPGPAAGPPRCAARRAARVPAAGPGPGGRGRPAPAHHVPGRRRPARRRGAGPPDTAGRGGRPPAVPAPAQSRAARPGPGLRRAPARAVARGGLADRRRRGRLVRPGAARAAAGRVRPRRAGCRCRWSSGGPPQPSPACRR